MVYFVIGAPIKEKKLDIPKFKIEKSIKGFGKTMRINTHDYNFKFGNIDSMISSYDILAKLESQIEVILKKIEKTVKDIDSKKDIKDFQVEDSNCISKPINKFLEDFQWDDSRFPKNLNLQDVIKTLTNKANNIENKLKYRIQIYQDSKNQFLNINKNENNNILNKDLNTLIFENYDLIKESVDDEKYLFVKNSKYFTNFAVYVPKLNEEEWMKNYNYLNDPENDSNFVPSVVPDSDLKLNIKNESEYNVHIITVFSKLKDMVKKEIENKYNFIVKEVNFDLQRMFEKEENIKKANEQLESDEGSVNNTCIESFKDLYSTYVHCKVLKALVDSQLRYGDISNYILNMVYCKNEKEGKFHNLMIKEFAEKDKISYYGTKDQINDSEDFFPYACSTISFPNNI